VVSGASGGLGFNVSKMLIEKYGCNVIGIARNEKKMLNSIEQLGNNKDKFSYRLFDVSVQQNWKDFYAYLVANDVKIDVLINNAGFMLPFAKFEKYSENEIAEIVNTNFLANVYAIRTLLPLLKQSETPAIINVSSAAGLCAVVGESMYCATKFAMRGFTETLIQEYKGKIYVGGVYPGFIKTDILNRMSVTDKNNNLIQKMMMPVEKATKKITRGMHKRKKRMVMGFDGRSMSFFGRIMPYATPSIVRSVLKTSKLELFNEVFDNEKGE